MFYGRPKSWLVEPLLQEAVSQHPRCNKKIITLLSLLIGLGFAVLLSLVPYSLGGSGQRLTISELAITLATHMIAARSRRWAAPCSLIVHHDHAGLHHVSRSILAMASERPYDSGVLSEFVTMGSGLSMPRLIYEIDHASQVRLARTNGMPDMACSFAGMMWLAGMHGIENVGFNLEDGDPAFGRALQFLFESGVPRDSLFIQTNIHPDYGDKFNSVNITKQVEMLIANSLSNLGVACVDCLVLGSPSSELDQTMEAWRAMEDAVQVGLVCQLGISPHYVNTLEKLRAIHTDATLKPVVVQLPADMTQGKSGAKVLQWCAEAGVSIQVNGILGLAEPIIGSKMLRNLALKYHVTPQVLFLRFALGHGIVPLLGLFSEELVKDSLEAWRIPLAVQDAEIIFELLKQQWQHQDIIAELVTLNDAMDLNVGAGYFKEGGLLRDRIREKEASNPVGALMWRQQRQVQLNLETALFDESMKRRVSAAMTLKDMACPPTRAPGSAEALHKILQEAQGEDETELQGIAESALQQCRRMTLDEEFRAALQVPSLFKSVLKDNGNN